MADGKIIVNSQEKVIEGVTKTADTIKTTLGPSGKAVAINQGYVSDVPEISRDGATVAKSIAFKDQAMNMGAQLVKKAASLTEQQAGDGTSTTSILVKELCLKGQKAVQTGSNVNELKSGMLKAGKWMKDYIAKSSISIEGDLEKIRKVATISANNDPEIGDLVVSCMEKVGINGVITADVNSNLETEIDVTTGMKLDRGWSSPQYITNQEDNKCIMEQPYVLVTDEKISNVPQILPVIEFVMKSGRPLLIICGEMDDIVNTTLIMNTLQGIIRTCVVKGIDFGDSRKNIMQDISVATGGIFICQENSVSLSEFNPEYLGAAKKVIISRDNTIIFEGDGNEEDIKKRAEILEKRLKDPTISNYDKTKFEKRLANLTGGIGIIKAGGATDSEKLNRKATIEDAILASKSAISEGCAPGGGYIYLKGSKEAEKDKTFWSSLNGDEVEGAKIVFSSLPVILKTVVDNSGASSDLVLNTIEKTKKENWGYNAKTGEYCDLLKDGILDSAKVLRVALENAISTASMILLVDCLILEDEENKPTTEQK